MLKKLCFILFLQNFLINQNFSEFPLSRDDEIRFGVNWVWEQIYEKNDNLKSAIDLHKVLDVVRNLLAEGLKYTVYNNEKEILTFLRNNADEVANKLRELQWPECKVQAAIDWPQSEKGIIASFIKTIKWIGKLLRTNIVFELLSRFLLKIIQFLKWLNRGMLGGIFNAINPIINTLKNLIYIKFDSMIRSNLQKLIINNLQNENVIEYLVRAFLKIIEFLKWISPNQLKDILVNMQVVFNFLHNQYEGKFELLISRLKEKVKSILLLPENQVKDGNKSPQKRSNNEIKNSQKPSDIQENKNKFHFYVASQ